MSAALRHALFEPSCNGCHLDRVLKCSRCRQRYNEPHCFPCQHSFCREPCFTGLLAGLKPGELVQCPDCNNKYPVPEKGVDGFPLNHSLKGLLNVSVEEMNKVAKENQEKEAVKSRGFRPSMERKVDVLRAKINNRKAAPRIEMAKAGLLYQGDKNVDETVNGGRNGDASPSKDAETMVTDDDLNKHATGKTVATNTGSGRITVSTDTGMDAINENLCTVRSGNDRTCSSQAVRNVEVGTSPKEATPSNVNMQHVSTQSVQMADQGTSPKEESPINRQNTPKAEDTIMTTTVDHVSTQAVNDAEQRNSPNVVSSSNGSEKSEKKNKDTNTIVGNGATPKKNKDACGVCKEIGMVFICLHCNVGMCRRDLHAHRDDLIGDVAKTATGVSGQNKRSVEAMKKILTAVELNVLDYVTHYIACEAQPFEVFLIASVLLRKNVTNFKAQARKLMDGRQEVSEDRFMRQLITIQVEGFKYIFVIEKIKEEACSKPECIKLDKTIVQSIQKKLEFISGDMEFKSDILQRQLEYIEKLKDFQLATLYDPANNKDTRLMRRLRGYVTHLDKTDLGEASSTSAESKKKESHSFRYLLGKGEINAVWDDAYIDATLATNKPYLFSRQTDSIENIYRRTMLNLDLVPELDKVIKPEDFGVTFQGSENEKNDQKPEDEPKEPVLKKHFHITFNVTATPEMLASMLKEKKSTGQSQRQQKKEKARDQTKQKASGDVANKNTEKKTNSSVQSQLSKAGETPESKPKKEPDQQRLKEGGTESEEGEVKHRRSQNSAPTEERKLEICKNFDNQFPGLSADPTVASFLDEYPELLDKLREATEERNAEEAAAQESNKYGKCRRKPLSEKPLVVNQDGYTMISCPIGHFENGQFIPSLDDFEPPKLSSSNKKRKERRIPKGLEEFALSNNDSIVEAKDNAVKSKPSRQGKSRVEEKSSQSKSPKAKSKSSSPEKKDIAENPSSIIGVASREIPKLTTKQVQGSKPISVVGDRTTQSKPSVIDTSALKATEVIETESRKSKDRNKSPPGGSKGPTPAGFGKLQTGPTSSPAADINVKQGSPELKVPVIDDQIHDEIMMEDILKIIDEVD